MSSQSKYRKRVSHVVSTLSGGPGEIVKSLNRHYSEDNLIFILSHEPTLKADVNRKKVVFLNRKGKFDFLTTIKSILKIRRNSDIILSYDFASNMVCFFAVLFTSKKWLPSFHGLISAFKWWRRQLLRVSLKRANKVIVPSYAVKHKLQHYKLITADKIEVIYNGTKIPNRLAIRTPNRDSFNLVCLANFYSPIKGQRYLIEAMNYLPKNYSLTLIGSGNYKKDLIQLTKSLQMEERVQFIGEIKRERVYSILEKFDLMVIPSKSESFCLAAIEGMICGLPIVASNVGGLREVIDCNCGKLFNVGDIKSMVKKIREICENEILWEKLHKGAMEKVTNVFSEKQMVSQYKSKIDEFR